MTGFFFGPKSKLFSAPYTFLPAFATMPADRNIQKQRLAMESELRKFTFEVMGHISPTEWMTASEVIEEIHDTWKKVGRRKKIAVFFSLFSPMVAEEIILRPNYGSIFVAFAELEGQGLAESQWRSEPPEVTAKRRNLRL